MADICKWAPSMGPLSVTLMTARMVRHASRIMAGRISVEELNNYYETFAY